MNLMNQCRVEKLFHWSNKKAIFLCTTHNKYKIKIGRSHLRNVYAIKQDLKAVGINVDTRKTTSTNWIVIVSKISMGTAKKHWSQLWKKIVPNEKWLIPLKPRNRHIYLHFMWTGMFLKNSFVELNGKKKFSSRWSIVIL